jgi:hypothetical protein
VNVDGGGGSHNQSNMRGCVRNEMGERSQKGAPVMERNLV